MTQPIAAAPVSDTEVESVRLAVDGTLPRFLEELATLVNIDCGSYTRTASIRSPPDRGRLAVLSERASNVGLTRPAAWAIRSWLRSTAARAVAGR
jgi:hypothetical protein